jgi:hypothetical protein
VLYVHLVSHGLAFELTVRHLIKKGAVFSQIFALKYSDLCDFITQTYNDFDYGDDQNLEYREAINRPLTDHPDPRGPSFNCAMSWETEYRKIFETYATAVVDAGPCLRIRTMWRRTGPSRTFTIASTRTIAAFTDPCRNDTTFDQEWHCSLHFGHDLSSHCSS